MHLPLFVQTCAQRSASAVPAPPASKSRMPSTIGIASALSKPAGSTIGQAATHLPQRVQASSVSSTRLRNASTKVPPVSTMIATRLEERERADLDALALTRTRLGRRVVEGGVRGPARGPVALRIVHLEHQRLVRRQPREPVPAVVGVVGNRIGLADP